MTLYGISTTIHWKGDDDKPEGQSYEKYKTKKEAIDAFELFIKDRIDILGEKEAKCECEISKDGDISTYVKHFTKHGSYFSNPYYVYLCKDGCKVKDIDKHSN